MYYYNPNKPTGRRAAWIATAVYVAIWGVLMFLVVFPAPEKPEFGNGMLIDFGMLTADDEEAPVIEQQKREEASTTVSDQRTTRPAEQAQPAPERKVNPKAMFPGRTVGSTSTSEGQTEGQGNQGEETGSPAGSHEGIGQGNSSMGFDLAGRTLVGSLPRPVYSANESGKVVIQITVDAAGRVTSATYRAAGSTTNAGVLVNAAIKAARQARFSPSETQDIQTGTITYIFKMN